MNESSLLIRRLTLADEAAFNTAVGAWPADDPFVFAPEYDPRKFGEHVRRLEAFERGERLPERFVPATTLFAFAGQEIVGRIQLRHRLNDFLRNVGGHIGYGVLPQFRNRGYARAMLRHMLGVAATLGIDRVLVTCDEANIASARVAESCGGVLEGLFEVGDGQPRKRRYWIETAPYAGR